MIKVIDIFKDFVEIFKDNLNCSIQYKTELWEKDYMGKYPELLKKCKDYYELSGYDWKEVAETTVFNNTEKDFLKMLEGYDNILRVIKNIDLKFNEVFNCDIDINVVLYCGLCNAAGWVDFYEGKRAILYGLDKIASLNWQKEQMLLSLVSHELCHVVHFNIRDKFNIEDDWENNNYNNGIWDIYEEGFAQYFQQKLNGNIVDCRGEQWILDCEKEEENFKRLYLEALNDKNNGTKEFFGDWFKVRGISDAGYYLGSKFIEKLNNKYDINKIAALKIYEIKPLVISYLNNRL